MAGELNFVLVQPLTVVDDPAENLSGLAHPADMGSALALLAVGDVLLHFLDGTAHDNLQTW
jgi:hypothetical protein